LRARQAAGASTQSLKANALMTTLFCRARIVTCLLLLGCAVPAIAAAQQPLPDLTLEELMRMDSGRVFGASERTQPVTEAPASVSFITAEEISRYGYRTLADILRSVRGIYITDDRNFSLIGTRGFSKPGDYNSRVLLLVNGHRVNDNVYGQAEIGAEFGIDAAMFERVEIIRGPASSLYGDSAFFAVINVITKRASSFNGLSARADAGTLGTYLGRLSAGHRFTNNLDVAVSATAEGSSGNDKLYFPYYDTPETNHGIAEGLDGERLKQIYGQATYRSFTFTGAYGTRHRDVPTASFLSIFNYQPDPERTTDRHSLADLEYVHQFTRARLTLRGSYDRFTYDGAYPTYPIGSPDTVALVNNSVLGGRWSAGARLTTPLPGRQWLTGGIEFIDNLEVHQHASSASPTFQGFTTDRPSTQQALYIQDEIKLTPWLITNGGLRYDQYQDFFKVTPRAAVIVMPSANQSFKYLYGRAFRAPNAYELNRFYFGDPTLLLVPETIGTHELVWERYANDWLRTSVSGYWYRADQLITQVPTDDPTAYLQSTFVNEGKVRANGLELEAQVRLRGNVLGLASYALQRATDIATGELLVNSPRQLAKMRISVPGPIAKSLASLEVQYIGSRRTILGNTVGDAATASLTMIVPFGGSFELIGSIRNIFDTKYLDPASDEKDVIAQNGRTMRIGLRWKQRPN
jgi:outer membrane receptor for ferrienterochelin and colicins